MSEVMAEIRRAARPYGATTSASMRLTKRQRQRACANGVLVQRHPGVFVDPAVPHSPEQDLMIAIYAARGPLCAGWRRSAAAVWGLTDEHPKVPEIVVPYRRYARVSGAVVRRSSDLCEAHVMLRRGIPVTKPLITAVDLGVVLSPMDLAEVYVRARQMKLFEPAAVRATITRLARPGRTGIRTAREATRLVMIGDRPAESVLELRFHHDVGRYLPPYEYQWPVHVNDSDYRIDFAYPSVMLAIELDGYDKRRSRASLDSDARRGRALLHAGWKVAHFTWTDITVDPHGVAVEILGLLRASRYRFGS
jgi:hypothetical protein